MSLAEFHFIRPGFLLGLALLVILVWLLRRAGASGGAWAQVCDSRLREFVLDQRGAGGRQLLPGLLIATAAVLIIAAAGPTLEREPTPVFKDPSALVIALDLSRSMQASDLEPSRLVRARFKIADMLERRRDGQTALIVFAASSFVVSPLTDDTRTIASQLPALTPELMPSQGSRPDVAIAKAAELIEQAGLRSGDVLLVTDDAPASAISKAVKLAGELPLRISVLGVGSPEGAPVPRAAGRGFIQKSDGSIVTSVLQEDDWRELAAAGSGVYRRIRNDDADTKNLLDFFDNTIRAETDKLSDVTADAWRDLGPWLVLLALPFAAFAFRKGVILTVLILPLTLSPQTSEAFEWKDLWLRPDQQAAQALRQGDSERAAELFTDPKWQAAARYRNGEYDSAAELLKQHQDAASLYNRGNAHAQQGDFEAALADYDESLKLNPDDEDAAFNRKLIEDLLEQQQQQQQGGGEDSEEQEESEQSDSGETGEQESQNNERNEQDSQSSQSEDGNAGEDEGEQSAERNNDAENDQTQAGDDKDSAEGEQPPEDQNRSEQEGEDSEQEASQADSRPAEETEGDAEERAQAVEQWLRRIPDDPGGLLRRKFLYQYRQLPQRRAEEQQW